MDSQTSVLATPAVDDDTPKEHPSEADMASKPVAAQLEEDLVDILNDPEAAKDTQHTVEESGTEAIPADEEQGTPAKRQRTDESGHPVASPVDAN